MIKALWETLPQGLYHVREENLKELIRRCSVREDNTRSTKRDDITRFEITPLTWLEDTATNKRTHMAVVIRESEA